MAARARGDRFLVITTADDVLAVRAMLELARHMRGRSQHAYLRCAGEYLWRLQRGRDHEQWAELVRVELDLGSSRAHELMLLARIHADQAKAKLEDLREKRRARDRKSRTNKQKRTRASPRKRIPL